MQLSRSLKLKRSQYTDRHDKVIFLGENTWPHIAKVIKETLDEVQWDVPNTSSISCLLDQKLGIKKDVKIKVSKATITFRQCRKVVGALNPNLVQSNAYSIYYTHHEVERVCEEIAEWTHVAHSRAHILIYVYIHIHIHIHKYMYTHTRNHFI